MCIHALDLGYSHVTCFGQRHMSRSDRGPVLRLDFKGTCMFPVVFLHRQEHALGSPLAVRGGRGTGGEEPPQLSPTYLGEPQPIHRSASDNI